MTKNKKTRNQDNKKTRKEIYSKGKMSNGQRISAGGFGRRQVELVDKRKKKALSPPTSTSTSTLNHYTSGEENNAAELKDARKGTKSLPSWAVMPDSSKPST